MIHDILKYIAGIKLSDLTIDRVAFWTFVLTIITLFLWWIARKQLGGINKTTKADFIKKFTDDFFSETTRDILMLLDYNALNFSSCNIEYDENIPPKTFPYFSINEDVVKQIRVDSIKQKQFIDKKFFSSFEMDDYVLGFFEDFGFYEKNGLINIEGVYNSFDWYIDMVWNNEEIKRYIMSQTKDEKEGYDIYEDFRYIYEKCDSYGKAKSVGKWMWCWKIKWFLSPK